MAAALKALGAKDAVLPVADLAVGGRGLPWTVRMAVLGLREGFYAFDQLKTQKKPAAPALGSVTLAIAGAPVTLQAQAALKEAVATADGADLARTLGNLPPNLCTPSYLADEARKLAKQFKLGIEVLERKDMERLGMGALLAVTAGSRQPPKLIVLRYAGAAKSKKPLVLVGKGITFDTGGISLKPGGRDGRDEVRHVRRGQRAGRDPRAGRHARAGQRDRRRPDLREHARRRGHAARRHRHHDVRPDRRDPEYRRRRPPDPLRRPHLRGDASIPRRWSTSPRSPAPA